MARNQYTASFDSASELIGQFGGKTSPCAGGEAVGFNVFPTTEQELRDSQAICQTCPFRRECKRHAVKFEETGVWGGFYFSDGKLRKDRAPFIGKRGVRTLTEDEMFDEVYVKIPVDKLDDFNNGVWDPYDGYLDDADDPVDGETVDESTETPDGADDGESDGDIGETTVDFGEATEVSEFPVEEDYIRSA